MIFIGQSSFPSYQRESLNKMVHLLGDIRHIHFGVANNAANDNPLFQGPLSPGLGDTAGAGSWRPMGYTREPSAPG